MTLKKVYYLYLFGSRTPTGQAFLNEVKMLEPAWEIISFSRSKGKKDYVCDLDNPNAFNNSKLPIPNLIVSFAPIWKLSSFLYNLSTSNNTFFKNSPGIICCSSSSVVTKRFAFNKNDKNLVTKLKDAEKTIQSISFSHKLDCLIIKPTLIYGTVNNFKDKNLSLILKILRILPFIIFPRDSGLRQPIHAKELAKVVFYYSKRIIKKTSSMKEIKHNSSLEIGGDQIITYKNMIIKLQKSLPDFDRARKSRIILIPNRIFYFLTSFVVLYSPKIFESLLRITADLSNFKKVHEIIGNKPKRFPIE